MMSKQGISQTWYPQVLWRHCKTMSSKKGCDHNPSRIELKRTKILGFLALFSHKVSGSKPNTIHGPASMFHVDLISSESLLPSPLCRSIILLFELKQWTWIQLKWQSNSLPLKGSRVTCFPVLNEDRNDIHNVQSLHMDSFWVTNANLLSNPFLF